MTSEVNTQHMTVFNMWWWISGDGVKPNETETIIEILLEQKD